jgi:hypothetical protein
MVWQARLGSLPAQRRAAERGLVFRIVIAQAVSRKGFPQGHFAARV